MDNKAFQADKISGDSPIITLPIQTHRNGSNLGVEKLGESEDQTVRMKRQIGLLGGVALTVGTMIGSGIFITPQRLLVRTDSVAASLAVWVACGFLAMLSALSYCELGTVIPRSGGEHSYFMETFAKMHPFFGPLPAFLFSWLTVILLKPSSLAIVSLAFGQYVLYPILSNEDYAGCDFQDSDEYQLARKLLAVFVTLLIAAVNIFSVKFATRVAIVFLIAKISGMGLMIGIGIYNISRNEWGALDLNGTWWDEGDTSIGKVAASFYSGLWAYDGWNNLNFATEELSNPSRNLPLAVIFGIILVTCLYTTVNVAYLTALSKQAMINSDAVAIDVGDKYLGAAKWIVPIMVTLSVAGTGNGSMFSAGRISYVSGREGHMADIMSYVHAIRLTPVIAILVNAILAIVMIFASEINKLIDLFGFASWIIYGLALACVIILRITKPKLERPFRVPIIIPIIATFTSACLVVIPLVDDWQWEYLLCLAFALLGVVVYYFFVFKQYRPKFMDNFTKIVQKATMAAPSPYKQD